MRFPFYLRAVFVVAALTAGGVVAEATTYPRVRQAAARNLLAGYAVEPVAGVDSLRPAELLFLERAAGASRLQIRLAELGSGQANSSDVRNHAERVKGDNRQLLDSLTAMLQRKNSSARPVVDSPASTETYALLAAKSGAEFDREFVRVMADLHDATISLFEQTVSETKDAEIKELAAAQLPVLRAHKNRIVELKQAYE